MCKRSRESASPQEAVNHLKTPAFLPSRALREERKGTNLEDPERNERAAEPHLPP